MMRTKIQLSPAEQRLLANAELILTKNRVLAKMQGLLEVVQTAIEAQAQTFSKPHVFDTAPKISRGENYGGLPYLVLDYPRVFRHHDVFAVRSFFWWGNFFSSTLQLGGAFKALYLPNIEAAFSTFSNHHICINPDPWQHHFEQDNYKWIAGMEYGEFKKLLHPYSHLKLATKLPVTDWPQADIFLIENWQTYINILA